MSQTRGSTRKTPRGTRFPYLQVAADLPLASSEYDFFDESVPFVQLTLRGLVTLSTVAEPLRQSGTGIPEGGGNRKQPEIFLYRLFLRRSARHPTEYPLRRTVRVVEGVRGRLADKAGKGRWTVWKNAAVLEHRMLTKEVAAVTYDNGEEILVNYGGEPFYRRRGHSETYVLSPPFRRGVAEIENERETRRPSADPSFRQGLTGVLLSPLANRG